MLGDAEYHERREAQERDQAARSEDPGIRKIHDELADQHADRRKVRQSILTLFND